MLSRSETAAQSLRYPCAITAHSLCKSPSLRIRLAFALQSLPQRNRFAIASTAQSLCNRFHSAFALQSLPQRIRFAIASTAHSLCNRFTFGHLEIDTIAIPNEPFGNRALMQSLGEKSCGVDRFTLQVSVVLGWL
jgi:hypothetical protein